jgi:RNA polymerase sigma-70 factor (ECF subfamily)
MHVAEGVLISQGPPIDSVDEFTAWVRPHLPEISALTGRLAPRWERDDVIQEALARAWSKRGLFDPNKGSAAGWLLAITADQSRRACRRRRPWAPCQPAFPGPRNRRPTRRRVRGLATAAQTAARGRLFLLCGSFDSRNRARDGVLGRDCEVHALRRAFSPA